ncbi:hypothetical protein N0B40_02395 [Chryseobacterium oranimense]|uniref:hypothetical protein n=1 Tax=Chryseobacterium oranimense TaxID=421058 RepID=UPI0021B07B01|nr:hypothetical protein [Chryseobacterium oranimense]UWX61131.1 hypothetical protein N0B40_02395 [Chryseobacterium oranimense]
MPFDQSVLTEKLKKRDHDFLILKKDILETVFNKDEIVFILIKVRKSEIPDIHSFIISAMAASGSDEFEIQNSEIIPRDKESMAEKIADFERLWKISLGIEAYLEGEVQYVYQDDADPGRKNYDSEISYIIETGDSFIYFFTHHFYY